MDQNPNKTRKCRNSSLTKERLLTDMLTNDIPCDTVTLMQAGLNKNEVKKQYTNYTRYIVFSLHVFNVRQRSMTTLLEVKLGVIFPGCHHRITNRAPVTSLTVGRS